MQDLIAKWRREADALLHADVLTEFGKGMAQTLLHNAEELARGVHDTRHDDEFVQGCHFCDAEYQSMLNEYGPEAVRPFTTREVETL